MHRFRLVDDVDRFRLATAYALVLAASPQIGTSDQLHVLDLKTLLCDLKAYLKTLL